MESLHLWLEAKSIATCSSLPPELAFMGGALQHQVDVFAASRHHDIVLDLSPTGTGKTQAGLSVLIRNRHQSAVYIAPTNALISQQTETAKKFVRDAGLPHVVKSASAKEIKSWPEDLVGKRSGEKLYNVLRNPATVFSEIQANQPILLVTNPDIFYYATFFAYNRLDRDNVAATFYNKFATVIFDEFHLYDAKQLVGLLFYLALSQVFGFFQNGRRVVLLTATPEPACERALEVLAAKGVKIKKVDGGSETSQQIPSQTAVELQIQPKLERDECLAAIATEVERRLREQPNCFGAVILDSKDWINRLASLLEKKGWREYFGRITGSTPHQDRMSASQRQVILATSTVDVGFNFKRTTPSERQNLDWLIFSARDRFSFWQRIGRVGRVLGKKITDIPSQAIAYLPPKAWEEGITNLDCSGGRTSLQEKLCQLSCLDRPFLDIYWRSEALLEIARPLWEIEEQLTGLPQAQAIGELYETMRSLLGGKRDWNYYRYRMKILRGAEEIAKTETNSLPKQWKFIKGGQAFVKTFVKTYYPEDWEELQSGRVSEESLQEILQDDLELAEEIKEFAEIWKISHAPLFQFRDTLFENLPIRDWQGLLLDESEETILDPIHLLRYYEFEREPESPYIEVLRRVDQPYQLRFHLHSAKSYEEFKNDSLNKLTAFSRCRIERQRDGSVVPTPLLEELKKTRIPGVIVPTAVNQGTIIQLQKQGITSYPMVVSCQDANKEHTFFPNLNGILAIAMGGVRLKLPDEENFYIC